MNGTGSGSGCGCGSGLGSGCGSGSGCGVGSCSFSVDSGSFSWVSYFFLKLAKKSVTVWIGLHPARNKESKEIKRTFFFFIVCI